MILITGCGRSGTGYTCARLQKLGMKIGHERIQEDGTVDWYAAAWPKEKLSQFSVIYHQIRNPLLVIRSCHVITQKSWNIIKSEIPVINSSDSLLLKCMKYYCLWNIMAARISSHTFRVEDINTFLITKLNFPESQVISKDVDHSTNSRQSSPQYPLIKWTDIKQESIDVYKLVLDIAISYGYQKSELEDM